MPLSVKVILKLFKVRVLSSGYFFVAESNCIFLEARHRHQFLTQYCSNDMVNPLNPESDQHLISPYSNMAETFIKITRMKEMIATVRIFDC